MAGNGLDEPRAPHRGRPQGRRLSSLSGWRRWACTAAITAFALIPAISGVLLAADGWVATGDAAIIGIRSHDAWTADAPLVGQPTTGREVSGVDSFHPGPLENWMIGPFIRTLGPQLGLLVGVAAINGGALGTAAWLAFRRGGPTLLALTATATALLVHALGTPSLTDPFNSELPTYPTLLAALAAWSVLQRDLVALPILVVAASVAIQAHVVGGFTVLPLVVAAAGSLVIRLRRRPALWGRVRGPVLVALALGSLCWLPPLAQELSAGPSNVAALLRTAGAPGFRLGPAYSAERVVTAIAPVPLFARPSGAFGFLEDRSVLGVFAAALIVGIGGSAAVRDWSRGRKGPARFWALAAVALVTSAFGALRSPPVAAFRVDTSRWLWTTGLLVWLSSIWSGWSHAPSDLRRQVHRFAPAAAASVALALLASVVATSGTDRGRDHRYVASVEELSVAVRNELPSGRYHLVMSGTKSVVVVGPGLAYALVADGYELTVDGGPFGVRFGGDRSGSSAAVDGTIEVFDLAAGDTPPDGTVLARTEVEDPSGAVVTVGVVRR